MTLERAVENALVTQAKKDGVLCLKLAPKGLAGWPDRTLLADGRVMFIETKRPQGGRLSPQQRYWLRVLTDHGFTAVVCKDADEARQIVRDFQG